MEELRNFIVLSDFHLYNEKDIETFVNFLTYRTNCDAIFFLGDIFEFLSYDSEPAISFYERAVDAIRSVSKTKKVYYIEGNHDFCLGERFTGRAQIKIIKDSMILNLHGFKVMLNHGDGMTGERRYGLMRKVLRSYPLKLFVRTVPQKITFNLGFFLASLGRNRRMRRSAILLKRMEKMVSGCIGKGVDVVITGHYHFPIIKRIKAGKRKGVWICVGGPNYYCEFANRAFMLKDYPDSQGIFQVFNLPSVSAHFISL